MERAGKPDFFRLDPVDELPYNDVHEPTSRDHFRLHRPGRTVGCISVGDWADWKQVDDLIRNTERTETVPDNFRPWWKIWDIKPTQIKRFGEIVVY